MMRRLLVSLGVALMSSVFAQDAAPPPPPAVKALEYLRTQPNAGPTSWTNGPYEYDGAGNIKAIGPETYVYDKIGRLKSSTLRGPDLSSMQTQSFDYDAYGNLISTSKLGQTVPLPITDATNRLSSLGYDVSGNVIAAGTQHYDYDAVGMPNVVRLGTNTQPRIIYAYTADDERLFAFDVSSGTTHWTLRGFDNKILRDLKQNGFTWTVERDYIYRDGLLLAALKSGGAVEHYSLDHLGTPRLVTDGVGNKVGHHVYWPFGEEWSPGTTQESSPLRFTGHERDADPTGGTAPLDYMHARYYGSEWGRFLSVDAVLNIDRALRQPQNWNRYSYVMNNPMRFTDPTGREHVQEPGFTKPLSEADWSNAPPVIQAAFYAEGALLSQVGEEAAAAAVTRFVAPLIGELNLSRRIMGALRSSSAATRLEGEAAATLGRTVTGFQRVVTKGGKVVGEIDVETTKAIVEVTSGKNVRKLKQVAELIRDAALNPTGKPVVVFAPNITPGKADALVKAGAIVVRTVEELAKAAQ
ncbi:MAG TPA: RHS repeat-associated core domain-containing protein [Thermoanaerobaculia bacterium]|jgi:RHS repeat-associated protein|nr:RHS repeat-associated core domain-containing protein [Thermoanaerobaculia bacterium]